MVLKHPQCHGGSEYVLSFEIGQWEGGFYSERTNTHTHPHTLGNYNIDILIYIATPNLYIPLNFRTNMILKKSP